MLGDQVDLHIAMSSLDSECADTSDLHRPGRTVGQHTQLRLNPRGAAVDDDLAFAPAAETMERVHQDVESINQVFGNTVYVF